MSMKNIFSFESQNLTFLMFDLTIKNVSFK